MAIPTIRIYDPKLYDLFLQEAEQEGRSAVKQLETILKERYKK